MARDDPSLAVTGLENARAELRFQKPPRELGDALVVRRMRAGIYWLGGYFFILWKRQSAKWESSC